MSGPLKFYLSPLRVTAWGMGLMGLLVCAGCGSEQQEIVELNSGFAEGSPSITPTAKKETVTTVTPTKGEVATSPAKSNAIPSADADAATVCLRFMELLQSGNRIGAGNLLTRTALTATTRAGLELEPMGSDTSRYEMGETRYATIKNDLAQVECEIIDTVEGAETRSPVTWLVRKKKMGWRISGLVVQLEPGQPLNLLSFENLADVQAIKRRATGDALAEIERGDDSSSVRQAQAEPATSDHPKTLK